jgi:hypothetical protein
MADKKQANDQAVKTAKLASVKRLCASMATAQQKGTLRPVNPATTPILASVRVKST